MSSWWHYCVLYVTILRGGRRQLDFYWKMTRFLWQCAFITSLANTRNLSQVYQSNRDMNRPNFMLPFCTVCDSLVPITSTGNLSEASGNLHLRSTPRTKLAIKAPRLAGNLRNFSLSRHLTSYLSDLMINSAGCPSIVRIYPLPMISELKNLAGDHSKHYCPDRMIKTCT